VSDAETKPIVESATKWISLVSLIIAVVAAFKALPLDADIKSLQAESVRLKLSLDKAKADMEQAEASRKLTMDLYKEVLAVLGHKDRDPREEEAIRVLVESLADDPFRWKLLQALAVGAKSPEVQKKADTSSTFYREEHVVTLAAQSNVETKPAANAGSRYGAYNIDAFYCEATKTRSQALAANVQSVKDAGASGRWRVRMLPEDVNMQPGYSITTNLIRYNADEKPIAEALAKDLQAKLGVQFQAKEIAYPTPNYVSVFFCQT